MSDIIKLLPDSVANQIAAGEVVQRPASVVKELMENAIDADAERIQLIVKDAGRSLIQVIDNGKGMSATDARMSFERHATSKIRTTEDIFAIHTKGFRGEALASIAAVAQVEMKTRMEQDEVGHLLRIEGSDIKEQSVVATPVGTSIAVKNLFFNVPARRNFLKNNSVELKHIIDEFQRVALTHPEVAMSLHHNENELFNLPKSSYRQRIVAIFGSKFNDKLVPINEDTEVVRIEGFIVKPEFSKKKRGEQFFFVNNRFIKSQYLHYAVNEGFDNLIPHGYYPSYFIKLSIDPKHIDINIHPTKTEIKFDDEFAIFAILKSAVKHSLGQYNIAPSLDFELNPDLDVRIPKTTTKIPEPRISVNPNFNPFEVEKPSYQAKKSTEDFYASFQSQVNFPSDEQSFDKIETTEQQETLSLPKAESSTNILQIHQKYLICQDAHGIRIIDQYRAHQRVLFEQYLEQINQHHNLSQQLMFPINIPLTTHELHIIKECEEMLFQLGFDIEIHLENIEIKALPINLNADQVSAIIDDIVREDFTIDDLDQTEKMALKLARSTAIKGGQSLNFSEMNHLVASLYQTSNPNYSPDGKAIFMNISLDDIKKQLQ